MLLLIPAYAQEFRGTISGKVTDAQGAVIQKATITAVGPSQTYKTVSGADGVFTIPFVQPATYQVTIAARGFKIEQRPGILIDINSRVNLEVALQVGANTETIVVQSAGGLTVNTEDASGGTIMDPEKVQQLPLNGRQSYMLLSLVPGTQFTVTQFGSGGYSGTRGWDESNAYSINGQSGSFNQFTLDGAPVSQQNGGGSGTWNIAPNIDAIEEFKVMTNTYDAQYGRYAGGTVNTILKSGQRQFHGTVFDFWRNSVLDANTFDQNQVGAAKPFHNQHQFGGTFGGPVIPHKDKLFFFFSFEGWREVQPNDHISSVPTADMFPDANGNVNLAAYQAAKGDGHIYDPATVHCSVPDQTPCQLWERDPFPADTILASRINPIAVKIMSLYPKPNLPGYFNNYVYNGTSTYRYNQPIGRGDYTINDSTKLSGTFAWWSGLENRNGNGYPGAIANGNINNYRSTLTQTLDLTHTFNPNLFGDVRVSFNRALNLTPDGALSAGLADLSASDLGLTMPAIPTTTHDYMPEISVERYNVLGGNTKGVNLFETYVLQPSLTQVVKRHNLHYGFEYMLFHDNVSDVGQPNGAFNFGTGYTWQFPKNGNNTGGSVPDLYLGYPDGGSVQDHTSTYISYKEYGAYIQDDWKVTSKLALNFGLRWDTETSPTDRNHRLAAGLCLTCINTPVSTALGTNVYGTAQFETNSLTPYENTMGTFQPKFGASYAITDKLVVRGGYGLGTAIGIELGGASPWNQDTGYNTQINTDNWTPTEYFNQGNPFPDGYTPAQGTALGALTYVGDGLGIDLRNRKIPLVQSFSFGFQGELPLHILGDVEYVGALTNRIRSSRQYDGLSDADVAKGLQDANYLDNQVANPFYGVLPKTVGLGQNPTVQASTLMVPYPQFNRSLYIYTHADGYQNYHSLIAKAEKRMTNSAGLSKGLSFLASFTWAKLMVANGYLNNGGAFKVDDKPVYHWDGGNGAPTWSLSFSGLYGLPFGKGAWLAPNANRVVDALIGGWNLDWIFQNRAGNAFGIPNGDIFGCGQYNVKPAHKSYSSWANNSQSTCWANPPEYYIYTFDGTTSKVRQPWSQQTELGMMKKFPLKDQVNLQFKAEAFNATNTPIFGGANGGSPEVAPTRIQSVADPNQPGAWQGYGTVGSTQQNFPRQFQFSLKVEF